MAGKHGFVYVLLAMVVPEGVVHRTSEASGIVHRAFSGLVNAGGCRMRWIEDVGAVVERVVGLFDKLFGAKDGKTAKEWFELGFAAKDIEKEKQLEYYTKALEINPRFVEAWFNKGDILRHLRKYVEAMVCFDKALEIDPSQEQTKRNREIAREKTMTDTQHLMGVQAGKGNPITFSALPGDELEIIATNPGGGEICACFYNESGEWTGIFTKTDITVLPVQTPITPAQPIIPPTYLLAAAAIIIALTFVVTPRKKTARNHLMAAIEPREHHNALRCQYPADSVP